MGYFGDLRRWFLGLETEADRRSREISEEISKLDERLDAMASKDAEVNKSLDETDAIFKSLNETGYAGD